MSYETFELTVDERIAHIELSRPEKLNTMNQVFWEEFPAALRDIDREAQARVVVISAQGKHFTAGMDLAELGKVKAISSLAAAFRSRGE